ncbi:GDSL-type esterase/lipase family protein [Nocardioides stalactiti]|uniref:GDSL-type esterase/lipase family protein n=1 Tax=Nocardioides stalactiti TaxID=2755356 RepID=UPI001601B0F6|nr:GDSL-type esterase/lipase family protein [Nocardioides stalactiti]
MRRILGIALVPLLLALLPVASPPGGAPSAAAGAAEAVATSCSGRHWVASWYAAPGDAVLSQPPVEQTFRVQVMPTRQGSVARFRLSNRFGNRPVRFGAVTVGRQDSPGSAAIEAGTLRALRFDGQRALVLPPGADVLSDPVRLRFPAFRALLVSMHVVGSPGGATQHGISEQTTWQTAPLSGDHTASLGADGFVGLPIPGVTPALPQGIPYVIGMDVRASRRVGTVVTFGDSITDGTESEISAVVLSPDNIDTFTSYPEQLGRRIRRARLPLSVANAAISGNQLLADASVPIFGPSGLSRLRIDALARAGATTLILLEGINDIGQSFATRDELVAGYREAIDAAHERGIRVLLGTLTPQNGALQPGYGAMAEPTRVELNRWIRHQHRSDGIVDFDRAVRDPEDPSRIREEYDGGDGLHFSAEGYRAMAAAVPLRALRLPACD